MTAYRYKRGETKIKARKRAIALGFFDGVHIGHRKILEKTVSEARARGLSATVFTFISESMEIKSGGARLYSTEEKLALIDECGINEVILVDFADICDMDAEQFVTGLLVDELSAELVLSGSDFRFGKGALMGTTELGRIMAERGAEAIVIPDVEMNGERVSTTAIKKLLSIGDAEGAARLLGAPYCLIGRVEHGRGVGKRLGFPTINIPLGIKRGVLRRGVYISEVDIGGVRYPSLTNVGICPTYSLTDEHTETYIIGMAGNLYNESVTVIFKNFLRDEIAFSSENELIMQINVDINKAKEEFFKK